MIGYLTVWDCGCADAQLDPNDLPKRCPGHKRPRITDNSGHTVAEIGASGAEFPLGHDCDTDRPCPPTTEELP